MFRKKFGLIALLLCIVLTVGYFAINTGAVSTVLLAIQGAITDGNLVKFSGNNGIGVDTGLSATNVVKCKFDATSAPTVNNDVDEGYTIGSQWYDVTNDKEYVCLDNTDGAAVWTETTGGGGGATTFTGLTDTPANYTGSSLKHVRVNVGETALEFVELGGGDMLKATYDTDEDGDIDVAAGGTEKSSWTLYAIPYLSGTTTFGEIPIGTAEYCLTVNAGETGYDWTLFDLSLYYLKTEINTLSKVEAIYTKNIIDSDELAALKFTDLADTPASYDNGKYAKSTADGVVWDTPAGGSSTFTTLTDTPANYTGSSLKFARVNAGETALEFAAEADPTVDTDAEIKAILVDEIIKTGDFTAGRIAKINNATGIIEQGTNTDTDVADAVTKKHSQNTDTQFDFYNALASDHTWSGDKDTQPVGESVVFGDLLYFNWTDKECIKAKADTETTMPGTRIALESKTDGQACLMLVKGYIRDDSAFEFAGAMVYVSEITAGAMTSTAPSTAGNQLQRVGQAKSADILFFDPSIDVGEIKEII